MKTFDLVIIKIVPGIIQGKLHHGICKAGINSALQSTTRTNLQYV